MGQNSPNTCFGHFLVGYLDTGRIKCFFQLCGGSVGDCAGVSDVAGGDGDAMGKVVLMVLMFFVGL